MNDFEKALTPERRLRIFQAFKILFGSQLGKEVLGYLEEEFWESNEYTGDTHDMARRLGRRQVIGIIRHRVRANIGDMLPQPQGERLDE
jgi:hypothetical protein